MSITARLSEKNTEFQKDWEDSKHEKQFKLSCKLVELRKQLNMTQQKFANHIGMKQPYLSRLENGEIDISLKKLEDIAKKLGGRIHIDIEIEENSLTRQ